MTQRRKALTLRLDPVRFRRLAAIAEADNRTPTNYVETLVLQDLQAKEEARRVISMRVAPEVATVVPGPLQRSTGESAARYRKRRKLFDQLLLIPDSD